MPNTQDKKNINGNIVIYSHDAGVHCINGLFFYNCGCIDWCSLCTEYKTNPNVHSIKDNSTVHEHLWAAIYKTDSINKIYLDRAIHHKSLITTKNPYIVVLKPAYGGFTKALYWPDKMPLPSVIGATLENKEVFGGVVPGVYAEESSSETLLNLKMQNIPYKDDNTRINVFLNVNSDNKFVAAVEKNLGTKYSQNWQACVKFAEYDINDAAGKAIAFLEIKFFESGIMKEIK